MRDGELVLDMYGTEIVEGEVYYVNQYDELIHPDNLTKYAIDYCELNKKTC